MPTSNRRTLKALRISIIRRLRHHLRKLGYTRTKAGALESPIDSKENLRSLHRHQRKERLRVEAGFIRKRLPDLIHHFASGNEITPNAIKPQLELIEAGTWQSELFRLASLTWRIPVSQGYGRRMRFLVWDESNRRLIGIIALGDPVFNLRVRDDLIGWKSKDREQRLVGVMDAYVLGALPPYNSLLGGKLVACLVRTKEVRDVFRERYGKSRGVISKTRKDASLVMITTSSALGRSSVYNRLVLDSKPYMVPVGYTSGWGHFHIPEGLFEDMRAYLRWKRHAYYDNHKFGNGPNWRLRTVGLTLRKMGLSPDLLQHGISREVYISRLALNADAILRGDGKRPKWSGLLSVDEVSALALRRWILPRAERRPEYAGWKKEMITGLLDHRSDGSTPVLPVSQAAVNSPPKVVVAAAGQLLADPT